MYYVKSLMYRNPVISALIINTITLFVAVYSVFYDEYWLLAWMPLVGILNRKIINKGENINKQKKNFILVSLVFMIICFLAYSFHMHNIRINQIMNGL
ncbi:hypothetical protein [Clostridium omnivorum]|uniref:Uncharacterized protein n=1 Tax=Clostridium omnivorum TaxID=1604902 RepID=A0ABQ5N4E6_9CLOT|nr:hypothetical protein [Clostridium sp. E14]GLC30098.1 hypothetical protein bsdE14_15080 [Clostridium sp. E14]